MNATLLIVAKAPIAGLAKTRDAPMSRRVAGPRPPSASADRRAHGPAGQLAVVVQPPQQQPLFLTGRRRTRPGR